MRRSTVRTTRPSRRAIGAPPIAAHGVPTRYGRVALSLSATSSADGAHVVVANVSVPATFASAPPLSGLVVRLRVPLAHAGKLSGVSVGGAAWHGFDAATETVRFTAAELTAERVRTGLPSMVATFAAVEGVRLRRASIVRGS